MQGIEVIINRTALSLRQRIRYSFETKGLTTQKRFSANELFKIRNDIPINMLIQDKLKIPSKISEGVFRFLSPLCNEFQTAAKPTTNLARYFRCERNFNTIELVMNSRGSGFVDSVLFLKLDTIRHRIIQRAGRLTKPQNELTLTMNASKAVQKDSLHFLEVLKDGA